MIWKALIFFSILMVGCQSVQEIEGPFELEVTSQGLEYQGIINLPTPCHNLEKEVSSIDGVARIDFNIIPPDPDVMCAQVIDEQSVGGSINLDDEVLVEIYIDGELVQRRVI